MKGGGGEMPLRLREPASLWGLTKKTKARQRMWVLGSKIRAGVQPTCAPKAHEVRVPAYIDVFQFQRIVVDPQQIPNRLFD